MPNVQEKFEYFKKYGIHNKDKKFNLNLAKIEILSTAYSHKDNKTICYLKMKTNFVPFENIYGPFKGSFVNNVLANYLPVIKVIFDREGNIVAKYYCAPGKKVQVLEYDNEYYMNKIKPEPGTGILQLEKGQLIEAKHLPELSDDEMYGVEYCDCFTVTGVAICHPSDTYSKEEGENIAFNNALKKAYMRQRNILTEIAHNLRGITDAVADSLNEVNEYATADKPRWFGRNPFRDAENNKQN